MYTYISSVSLWIFSASKRVTYKAFAVSETYCITFLAFAETQCCLVTESTRSVTRSVGPQCCLVTESTRSMTKSVGPLTSTSTTVISTTLKTERDIRKAFLRFKNLVSSLTSQRTLLTLLDRFDLEYFYSTSRFGTANFKGAYPVHFSEFRKSEATPVCHQWPRTYYVGYMRAQRERFWCAFKRWRKNQQSVATKGGCYRDSDHKSVATKGGCYRDSDHKGGCYRNSDHKGGCYRNSDHKGGCYRNSDHKGGCYRDSDHKGGCYRNSRPSTSLNPVETSIVGLGLIEGECSDKGRLFQRFGP